MIRCPICQKHVVLSNINEHLDSGCRVFIEAHLQRRASSTLIENVCEKHESCTSPPVNNMLKRAVPQQESNTVRNKPDMGSSPSTERETKRLNLRVAPLAEQVRPRCFDDIVGQESLTGPNGTLRRLIEQDDLPNLILWGPPGSGKTTIARTIAHMMRRKFYEISSLITTTTEYKSTVAKATQDVQDGRKKSIVFCDEIHRIMRPQQEIFLDAIRNDNIILIGATTENPSLNIRHALVYKCRIFTLTKPTINDIAAILHRAVESQDLNASPLLDDEFIQYIAGFAVGDSRIALNAVEIAADLCGRPNMTKDIFIG